MCVSFSLNIHFLLELIVISDTHTYIYIERERADELKENEINDCRMEFESTSCIIDFLFYSRWIINEAVKFYNNDHLSYFCFWKKQTKKENEKWVYTYLFGLLCFRRLLLLLIGIIGGVWWSFVVFVDSIISLFDFFKI